MSQPYPGQYPGQYNQPQYPYNQQVPQPGTGQQFVPAQQAVVSAPTAATNAAASNIPAGLPQTITNAPPVTAAVNKPVEQPGFFARFFGGGEHGEDSLAICI